MEDISSMWKYCICFIAAIGLLVLLYRFFYIIDGFIIADGCPGSSVWNPVAKACRDPDCKPGQINTRGPSGMICANLNSAGTTVSPTSQADCPKGTTFDSIAKQCLFCTTLSNGKTECRSAGTYDVKPTFVQGSINPDTVKTDVLSKPGLIDYPNWVDDPKTSSDLLPSGGSSSFLGNHYINGSTKLITESDRDVPYTILENDYENLINERNFNYEDDEDYTTEEAYNKLKNNRMTAQELIDSAAMKAGYRNSEVYGRYMENPSDMKYYDKNKDVYDCYEAEGFAPRL